MNRFINKAIAICKVFFNVSNRVERLPDVYKEYAGQYVLKIHPKGYIMQLRLYNNKGRPEFDIDLHDHDEDKECSHGGIHIYEYKWKFDKHINKNIYKRQSGRNLTDEEYITYIEGLDFSNIVQIKVRYK